MNPLDRITTEPGKCGARPYIRRMRICVKDVLELLTANATEEEILADYPFLKAEDIAACLECAAAEEEHTILIIRFIVHARLDMQNRR